MNFRSSMDPASVADHVRDWRTFYGLGGLALLLVLLTSLVLIRLPVGVRTRVPESVPVEGALRESIEEAIRLRLAVAELKEEVRSLPIPVVNAPPQPPPPKRRSFRPVAGLVAGPGFSPIARQSARVYIPSGAVFKAQLITPIKTSVQETFVTAQTTREFRMDARRVIPMGSRMLGRARLNPLLKGVIVRFNRLVTPDGIEHSASLLALSMEAFPELEGIYFSNDLETYSTIMAFGFLSGFAEGAQRRESTIFGSVPTPTLENQVLSGVSRASFRVADQILDDIRRRAVEYVVIPAARDIFVVVEDRYWIDEAEPTPQGENP